MCEPTNGGACGCAPTATTKQTKRRTCETAGCPRVSGDARFCRTCRAVAPVRAEFARIQAAHRREVAAYREMGGKVARALEAAGMTGASPVHAAQRAAAHILRDSAVRAHQTSQIRTLTLARDSAQADAVRMGALLNAQTTRANRAERDTADALGRLQGAHTARDEAVEALAVQRDHDRGQEVRLKRAKAQRDVAVAALARLAGLDHMEEPPRVVDCEAIIRHELHERLELANRHRVERDAATATVGQLTEQIWELTTERQAMLLDGIAKDGHANDLLQQRDDARIAYTTSRATVATLTTRIRIAWGVIGLLCVALGVVGVFG